MEVAGVDVRDCVLVCSGCCCTGAVGVANKRGSIGVDDVAEDI